MDLPEHIRRRFRELGRKGGLKRDPNTIPADQRREFARKAALARWSRTTPQERSAFAKRVAAKRRKSEAKVKKPQH